METKKAKSGSRTKSRKSHAAEPATANTPVPASNTAVDAPKLGAGLDPEEVQVRGPQSAEARAGLESEARQGRSAGQAGSLQGLSDAATAAPESVEELLEEGNTFEVEAVEGVEGAPDADQGEVRTHQFPEDDVPEEYLDVEP